jgi:hypothetical protein
MLQFFTRGAVIFSSCTNKICHVEIWGEDFGVTFSVDVLEQPSHVKSGTIYPFQVA